MAAKWSAFVSGAVLTAAQLNDTVDNFQDMAIFKEEQANLTAGGTFTSGSYLKRTLNTTVVNNITGCSISASVISLPAGTYYVSAEAPAHAVSAHRTRIQNTTAGTTLGLGINSFCLASAANVTTNAFVECVFTLSVTSNIELQHRCETTKTTNGFGTFNNFGDNEVYAQIQIIRIA